MNRRDFIRAAIATLATLAAPVAYKVGREPGRDLPSLAAPHSPMDYILPSSAGGCDWAMRSVVRMVLDGKRVLYASPGVGVLIKRLPATGDFTDVAFWTDTPGLDRLILCLSTIKEDFLVMEFRKAIHAVRRNQQRAGLAPLTGRRAEQIIFDDWHTP